MGADDTRIAVASLAQELPIQMSGYGETFHAELNSVSIGIPPNENSKLPLLLLLLESECTNSAALTH